VNVQNLLKQIETNAILFKKEKEEYIAAQLHLLEKQKKDYSCTIACLQHQLEEKGEKEMPEQEKNEQAVIIDQLHMYNKELAEKVFRLETGLNHETGTNHRKLK